MEGGDMQNLLRVAVMVVALGYSGPVMAGVLEDIDAAFKRGDYDTALRLNRPLAEQGNALGQLKLGIMYATGRGVPKDDVQAVKWYRLAAEQGYADAQCLLGLMYATGNGVPKDEVQAVEWFLIAAKSENRFALVCLRLSLGVSDDDDTHKGVPFVWKPKPAE